jgi:broad specificity phosphatase PhoE
VTTIFLARHGESDWNAQQRWQGHADRPLTERGRTQAAELAVRLEPVELDAVYASDLRRAHDTAAVVARAQDLDVVALPSLREVDVGSWSGLTREDAERRFPKEFEAWINGGRGWPDGETYDEMAGRVLAALARILGEHRDGRVLVVSHGGPIRAIHASALGMDVATYRRLKPVVPNARLSAVCAEDGRLTRLCAGSEIPELLG